MAVVREPRVLRSLHPVHAILLAFTFPLFLGALISDIAYWITYQIQWANFASWLLAGALLGGGVALLWALVDLIRFRTARYLIYFLLLLAMFALGLVNVLVHGKDAWAIMPESLYLSAICTVLALAATWVGYSGYRVEVR